MSRGASPFAVVAGAALTVAVAFLILPVVAVFVDVGPRELLTRLDDPVAIDALRLSLATSAAALAIIVVAGTPAAYLLATRPFWGRAVVTTAIELPLVLPPAVAGIALLAALGPAGLVADVTGARPDVALTTAAVVLALVFVASPFYVRQAQTGFAAVDRARLETARTLGATPLRVFARVAIPAARPALTAAAALSWGRAMGEFGATLVFAGSFRGETQTLPLAIFETFTSDYPAALAMSAVLVAVSAGVLLTARLGAARA